MILLIPAHSRRILFSGMTESIQDAIRSELKGSEKGPDHLFGLAFSGGGIRSATFNLGVLERLEQLKLLPFVDYLSTVSGGGYIGSWYLNRAS